VQLTIKTLSQQGLSICPDCNKLNPTAIDKIQCERCSGFYYARKPKSIEYTIAWTVAAIVMFIPANIYPIMIFSSLGNDEGSSIMSGIITFVQLGMYPVAAIIFIASFLVPLGKMLGILILIIGAKQQKPLDSAQRTKLYHIVEFLGPWSMLDVFVVAIMAAVVNLGYLTTIFTGPGITYFTLMVVCTIIAAESFDPRLLWDKKNNDN
jgi:paraquat-inducible protein A